MATAMFNNLYMAKMAAQERPCFVCNKFTPVVLTSANNSNQDWFYICRTHLGDRNFCTKIGGPTASPPKSPKKTHENHPPESDSVAELVASIGSVWNSWRKKGDDKKTEKKDEDEKKEEEEEEEGKKGKKEEGKEDKDKDKDKEHDEKKEALPPASPPKPIQFILHRDYFYLRQRELTKRIQKKEATEKLRTLQFPNVPKELPKK